jgi:hypothetical protein
MLSTTGLKGVEIRIRYVSEVRVLFCGDYITLVKIGQVKAADRPYNNKVVVQSSEKRASDGRLGDRELIEHSSPLLIILRTPLYSIPIRALKWEGFSVGASPTPPFTTHLGML